MRREGSPFQGLGVVALKELSDHLSSARMRVLEALVMLTAFAALYSAIEKLRLTTAEDPFLLLKLFTEDRAKLARAVRKTPGKQGHSSRDFSGVPVVIAYM